MIKSLNVNWSFDNFRDIVATLFGLLHVVSYMHIAFDSRSCILGCHGVFNCTCVTSAVSVTDKNEKGKKKNWKE